MFPEHEVRKQMHRRIVVKTQKRILIIDHTAYTLLKSSNCYKSHRRNRIAVPHDSNIRRCHNFCMYPPHNTCDDLTCLNSIVHFSRKNICENDKNRIVASKQRINHHTAVNVITSATNQKDCLLKTYSPVSPPR